MAALSVQKTGGGIKTWIPFFVRILAKPCPQPAVGGHAADDGHTADVHVISAARSVFSTRTSTMASW